MLGSTHFWTRLLRGACVIGAEHSLECELDQLLGLAHRVGEARGVACPRGIGSASIQGRVALDPRAGTGGM